MFAIFWTALKLHTKICKKSSFKHQILGSQKGPEYIAPGLDLPSLLVPEVEDGGAEPELGDLPPDELAVLGVHDAQA